MRASIYSDVWPGGDGIFPIGESLVFDPPSSGMMKVGGVRCAILGNADAPVVDRVTYCNVTAMAQDALLAVLKKHPCES